MVNYRILKHKTRYWAGILFAQILLFYLLSKTNFGVELANHIFEIKKNYHQSLFAKFPFSVGDAIYIFLISYLLFCLFKMIKKISRKKYLIKILIIVNIFYFLYQIFWGLLYFQKPIIEKLPSKNITEETVKKAVIKYVYECNNTRKKVAENKNGVFILKNIYDTKNDVLKGQKKIPKLFLNKKYTLIDNFKPTLFGKYFNYTGILGYYNPFTSEAQFNSNLPSAYLPFTLAHESAHQLGIAKEQEANFIAYLICKQSKNPELQYSANLYILKSLLNSLLEKDPEFVEQTKLLLSDGVKRDLEYNKVFFEKHQTWVNNLFYYTNDFFLKSNQQDGSITYSYFVELLLRYEN